MEKIELTKNKLIQLLIDFLAVREGGVKGFVDSIFKGKTGMKLKGKNHEG